MRTCIRRGALGVGAGLAVIAAGCGGEDTASRDVAAANVREEVREAYETASELTAAEIERFRAAMDEKLDDLEREIAAARERASDLADRARQSAEVQLAALEDRRAELREDLEALKADTREAWERTQRRFRWAVEELESGLEQASEGLGRDAV